MEIVKIVTAGGSAESCSGPWDRLIFIYQLVGFSYILNVVLCRRRKLMKPLFESGKIPKDASENSLSGSERFVVRQHSYTYHGILVEESVMAPWSELCFAV